MRGLHISAFYFKLCLAVGYCDHLTVYNMKIKMTINVLVNRTTAARGS